MREKWCPEFQIKDILDGDSEQYFVCQNVLRTLFCIGYKNGSLFFLESKSQQ